MRATSVSLTCLDLKGGEEENYELKLHMYAQRDAFIKHLKSKRILLEINILPFSMLRKKITV